MPSPGSGERPPVVPDRAAPVAVPSYDTAPAPAGLTWRRQVAGALQDRLPPTLRSARWALDSRSMVVIVAAGLAAVVVGLLLFSSDPRTETVSRPTFGASTATWPVPVTPSIPAEGPTSGAALVVHVAGLVATPGVYELPAGSRVVDALRAAGGAIAGTDLSQLNLARVVVDGEQVAVGVPPAPAGEVGATPGAQVTEAGLPMDLNLATEADLDALPGVGPVLAARIVAWRQANGGFSSVQELLEVSGIGAATLADIAPHVRV